MSLCKFRKKAGLTQAELATALNVNINTISRWELEKFTPRARDLLKLSKVLNCTVNDLLSEGE